MFRSDEVNILMPFSFICLSMLNSLSKNVSSHKFIMGMAKLVVNGGAPLARCICSVCPCAHKATEARHRRAGAAADRTVTHLPVINLRGDAGHATRVTAAYSNT